MRTEVLVIKPFICVTGTFNFQLIKKKKGEEKSQKRNRILPLNTKSGVDPPCTC